MSKRKFIFLAIIAAAISLGAALTIIQPFASDEKNDGIESPEVSSSASTPSLESRSEAEPASLHLTVGTRAPKIEGISAWINSDPIALQETAGKVVLIDFWTYSCVNCIRTFPFLKLWHSRYSDDGLVIVGVHSPEFAFEKDPVNVINAVEENGITWPVALDNDFTTWNNFSNRVWPAKYLIDHAGVLRYRHLGEGQYAETEENIRELLKEAGADLDGDNFPLPIDRPLDPEFLRSRNAEITREL